MMLTLSSSPSLLAPTTAYRLMVLRAVLLATDVVKAAITNVRALVQGIVVIASLGGVGYSRVVQQCHPFRGLAPSILHLTSSALWAASLALPSALAHLCVGGV